MEQITIITAIAGFGFGLVGAVLGIINTWRAFDRDRVKLKVSPVWVFMNDGEQVTQTLGMDVINRSSFPVTCTSVGFLLPDKKRLAIRPRLMSGGSLPQRLESRAALTAIAPIGTENHPEMRSVIGAYAQTACGCTFTGNSPALRGVVKHARSARVEGRD